MGAPNKNKTNLDENSKFVLFFTSEYFGLKLHDFPTDSAMLEKSAYAFYKLTFSIAGRRYGRILHMHSSIFGKFTLVYLPSALYNIFNI